LLSPCRNFAAAAVNQARAGHVVIAEQPALCSTFPAGNTTMKKLIAVLIASAFSMGAFAQASAPAAAAPAAPMAKKDEMKKEMPAKKPHAKKHHSKKDKAAASKPAA
jgi:hypothetical protein